MCSQTFLRNITWATALAGNNTTGICFRPGAVTPGPGVVTYLDNVFVAVPEPTTVALSLASAAGLILFIRRRKHEQGAGR